MAKNWHEIPPDHNYPRHRLIETYNWLLFKRLCVVAGWLTCFLVVLIVAAVERMQ